MHSYLEQLQSEQWKIKRLEIIKRDRLICRECQNQTLLEEYNQSYGNRLPSYAVTGNYLYLHYRASIGFEKIDSGYVRSLVKIKDLLFVHPTVRPWVMIYHSSYPTTEIIPTAIRRLKPEEYRTVGDLLLPTSPVRNVDQDMEWIVNRTLQVHHTYYQEGRLAWEYPSEHLISLCWSCHEALHKKTQVPYLNNLGNELFSLTPCARCNGAGSFPHFNHVEGGVCFDCRGAKYIELKR